MTAPDTSTSPQPALAAGPRGWELSPAAATGPEPRPPRGAWFWPVAVLATAVLGSLASIDAPGFYARLDKPAWAPPAWLFGPAWTLLYTLMALASWRIARTTHPLRTRALAVFGVQLVVNAAWSALFFALHWGAGATAGAALLFALVLASALLFGRIQRASGWMLAPAVAWVAFATALSASVWWRNPALLGG